MSFHDAGLKTFDATILEHQHVVERGAVEMHRSDRSDKCWNVYGLENELSNLVQQWNIHQRVQHLTVTSDVLSRWNKNENE